MDSFSVFLLLYESSPAVALLREKFRKLKKKSRKDKTNIMIY
jgi:hypothetical protein